MYIGKDGLLLLSAVTVAPLKQHLEDGCLFFKLGESAAKTSSFSSKAPPETQPREPALILLHHITILINVTDYAERQGWGVCLGEGGAVMSQLAKLFTGRQV